MICKECHAEGKKSTVREGMSMRTAMYFQPYYDEEGRHHHHDANVTTHDFKCSNGHEWVEKSSGKCWCGWGAK